MLNRTVAHDERLAQLSMAAEYLYLKTIPHLDRDGKILGYPTTILGACVPARAAREGWSDGHIAGFMLEWTETIDLDGRPAPLVDWYEAHRVAVCLFRGFPKNQTLKGNEPASSLPDPPAGVPLTPPSAFAHVQLQLTGPSTSTLRSRKGSEEKGSEEKRRTPSSQPPVATAGDQRLPKPPPDTMPQAAPDPEVEAMPALLLEPQAAETAGEQAALAAVYDHWRHARGRTSPRYRRISPKRREKIQARLREFTADELIRVIDAVAVDPWPDRARHDDIPVIFRSREQVDRFLEIHERYGEGREVPGGRDRAIYTRA